ncbi:MAG: hypothetical protein HFJ41_03975 [Clostridia bacterium]|nr:hypothetical protein [Clostridia bacterium]
MWFFILFFIVIISYLIWGINYNVKESQKKKEEENNINEKGKEYNTEYSTKIKHICGLPLSENSECVIHLSNKQIVIESTRSIFKLQKSRIIDMNIKTSKEVQNSISGAVGGAILLGPIGAFLGGSSTEFHRFFIIIYKNKENKEQCISFDMKEDLKALKGIYNYIEEFKNNIQGKGEIKL